MSEECETVESDKNLHSAQQEVRRRVKETKKDNTKELDHEDNLHDD